jgi:hypothetical protein
MEVLSKIEARIDNVSVNYEEQQFELWKQEQEKEFMEEIAFKRYKQNDIHKVIILISDFQTSIERKRRQIKAAI